MTDDWWVSDQEMSQHFPTVPPHGEAPWGATASNIWPEYIFRVIYWVRFSICTILHTKSIVTVASVGNTQACYVMWCMLCREVSLLRGGPLDLAIWVVLQYLIPLCLGTWWAFWLFYRRASLGHFLANSTLPLWGWIRLHGRDPLFGEQYAACHARRTLEVPVIYAIGGPRV